MGALANWSLRRRIIGLSGSVVVVILAAGLVGFVFALQAILTQSATDAALTQSYQLAHAVSSGEATPIDAVDQVASNGTVMQAVASSGAVLGTSEPSRFGAPLLKHFPPVGAVTITRLSGIGGDDDPYVIVAQTVADPQGEQVGLIVAQSLDVETLTIQTTSALLAAAGIALTVLLLLLVDRVVRGALEPVKRITRQAGHITQARSSDRLTVPNSGDEIAVLATTMNDLLDRLARAQEATQRFVSEASHELRSPLAALRAHVETARSGAEIDLGLVHSEILRVQGLVDDMLTLAKSDDHGLRLRVEPVDLDDIVETEGRRLRALTDGPVRVDIDPVEVNGDSARLTQILRNLTDNARRHATGGIRVVMANSAATTAVHVDNEGAPVPVEARDLVFDRFTRLDDSRERDGGGSGLGLAIARTLTEAHGGTLTVGEAPDGWCRFTLTLPRSNI